MKQQHKFLSSSLDTHAVGIVRALQKEGFTSYLVGGCVRDLLVGLKPKDFDIGTTARPEQIRRIIHRSYIIGKRFRLVLVRRDDQQYEVATFRREGQSLENGETPAGDNAFGPPEEDALRRDFTINGLFYDPVSELLIDYCQGMPDLDARLIRMIGVPDVRLREDPIRILRGVRLAHKLGFSIESTLRQAMIETASSLTTSVLPRRREEILKIMRLDNPSLTFLDLYDLGIVQAILPTLVPIFEDPERQQIFLHYVQQTHEFPVDSANPVDLFAPLLLGVLRGLGHNSDRSAREILESEAIATFFRDELGMFKFEQALFFKAVQLQELMKKKQDFEKRGPRRRRVVVTTDAFRVALQIAQRDYLLSSSELHFWENEAKTVEESGTAPEPTERRSRPRRRRRRPPSAKATPS